MSCIPKISLIWNLPVLSERTFGSTTGAERRAGNCRQAVGGGSSKPSPPLLQLSFEFTVMTNIQISVWKITNHKLKQLILAVKFLFGLMVNAIPNKTITLDSHRPFICSAHNTVLSGKRMY
jgi:hypothetical protein